MRLRKVWQRVPQLLRRRSDRDRVAGASGIGMVALLAAVGVVVGIGAPGFRTQLSNVGAWLDSSQTVVHVNGLSGRPDGRVLLRGANGHTLRVVQRGTAAYVIDAASRFHFHPRRLSAMRAGRR